MPDDPDPAEPDRTPRLTVDVAVQSGAWPPGEDLEVLAADCAAAVVTYVTLDDDAVATVAFADDAAVMALNQSWRGQPKPTNVLSFPAAAGASAGSGEPAFLGDVILADGVVRSESEAMAIPLEHHVRHLVVHGLLHLLGFDHESDAEAEEMEALETDILAMLGVPDPHVAPLEDAQRSGRYLTDGQ